jgi:hypothetical protein
MVPCIDHSSRVGGRRAARNNGREDVVVMNPMQ